MRRLKQKRGTAQHYECGSQTVIIVEGDKQSWRRFAEVLRRRQIGQTAGRRSPPPIALQSAPIAVLQSRSAPAARPVGASHRSSTSVLSSGRHYVGHRELEAGQLKPGELKPARRMVAARFCRLPCFGISGCYTRGDRSPLGQNASRDHRESRNRRIGRGHVAAQSQTVPWRPAWPPRATLRAKCRENLSFNLMLAGFSGIST